MSLDMTFFTKTHKVVWVKCQSLLLLWGQSLPKRRYGVMDFFRRLNLSIFKTVLTERMFLYHKVSQLLPSPCVIYGLSLFPPLLPPGQLLVIHHS